VDLVDPRFHVEVDLDPTERHDPRHKDFAEWLEAACFGILYATQIAGYPRGRWRIRRVIGGLFVDTIPGYIAIAAAEAAWSALEFDPPPALIAGMADVVRAQQPEVRVAPDTPV